MLTGKPPFQGTTVDELIEKIRLDGVAPLPQTVPDELAKVLRQGLAKRPQDRPASAAEMARSWRR